MSEVRTVGEHSLTGEMNLFVDAVCRGENVKGEAFAGTGKSSSLRAIEKYHKNKKGLYLCFNKTLERDARKLFKGNNVHISTAHSIALNSFNKEQMANVIDRTSLKWNYKKILEHSGLEKEERYIDLLSIKTHWTLLIEIVEVFLSTASEKIKDIHLTEKYKERINKLVEDGHIFDNEVESINNITLNAVNNIASQMVNMDGECPTTHDAYLKAWQLSNPQLNYDYVMFDEVQDASPVLLSVVLKQKCQQIFVGDRYQSIYQFRGSVNAMEIIPYETFPLSQSFRYGQEIADLANTILNHHNEDINIKGNGNVSSVVNAKEYQGTDKLLVITHTNKGLLEALITSFETNVPTKCIGDKIKFTLNNLNSLFSLHNHGKGELSAHSKFSSLPELISNKSINAETRYLAELILNDEKRAALLGRAIEWSIYMTDSDAHIQIVTAHGSKGLEFDTVMLSDDFFETVNSFGNGKPLSEQELYLMYVAVTRAKKTLVLADELYSALKSNLAFKLNKTEVPECLLDNLYIPKVTVQKKQPGHTAEPAQEKTTVPPKQEGDELPVKTAGADEEKSSSLESSTPEPKEPVKKPTRAKPAVNSGAKKEKTTKPEAKREKPLKNPNNDSIVINTGVCKETGEKVDWLPTDTSQFLNPNIAILGTMGTGKTQTTKSMLYQLHKSRYANTGGESFGILIFDYKNDYTDQQFVDNTNAIVLENHDIPINPFELFTKDRLAPVHTAKAFISTLTRVFKLGIKQGQALKSCIELAYESKGIFRGEVGSYDNTPPTISDVYRVFSSQDTVANDSLLSALSDLDDYEIFEKRASKCKSLYELLDGNIVVVKLSGIDSSLQSLIVALLLDSFYLQMHLAGKPKPEGQYRAIKQLVLVDEADGFLSQDFPSLRKILKEGREFGVGCILSTQSLDHFKTAENDYLQYQNAIICHRLNGTKSAQIKSLLTTEDKAAISKYQTQIGTLEKHHALFINSKKEVIYQESTAFWKFSLYDRGFESLYKFLLVQYH